MPNLKIIPASALLTAGQAATFQATDGANQPVNVTWSLTPQLGSLLRPLLPVRLNPGNRLPNPLHSRLCLKGRDLCRRPVHRL